MYGVLADSQAAVAVEIGIALDETLLKRQTDGQSFQSGARFVLLADAPLAQKGTEICVRLLIRLHLPQFRWAD